MVENNEPNGDDTEAINALFASMAEITGSVVHVYSRLTDAGFSQGTAEVMSANYYGKMLEMMFDNGCQHGMVLTQMTPQELMERFRNDNR